MCRILYKRHTERGSHAAQLTVYKRRHFVSAEQGPGRTLVFLRKCFPALNWNTLAHAHIQYTHAYSTYMPECTEIKAHRRFNTDQRTCTINRQKTNKQNKTTENACWHTGARPTRLRPAASFLCCCPMAQPQTEEDVGARGSRRHWWSNYTMIETWIHEGIKKNTHVNWLPLHIPPPSL